MTDLNAAAGGATELAATYDIELEIYVVLGKATMPIQQLLRMGRGAVVELERKIGDPVDIFSRGQLIARGEVVVVDDRLGVTITEIVRSDTQHDMF